MAEVSQVRDRLLDGLLYPRIGDLAEDLDRQNAVVGHAQGVALDTGDEIGEVKSYYELPQGLTLDVATKKGSVLVPYRPEIVERTDTEARRIIVKADVGLFE